MNKKLILAMVACLLMLVCAACGGGSDTGQSNAGESEPRPSRDGFDASTNQEVEFCGMVFSVPDYCEFEENEDGDLETMLEGDHGMILLQSIDSDLSEDEFTSGKADLIREWNEKIECETINDDGTFVATNDSGLELTGKSDMLLNTDNGKLIVLLLYQSENAEYDYISDFDAIVDSAHKAESSSTGKNDPESGEDSGSSASGSADRPETDISPEFKETMDSYEEFFDEYVEFMKKYDANASDPELLMEAADMLSKEAEMYEKLESMDESEMTTAEAAYYLEVTARIEAKLATVL